MTAPRVRVALPWLQSALAEAVASGTLPVLDSLAWLAGRGRLRARATADWRDWLLEPLGGGAVLAAAPAGPALAAQQGQPVDGTGSWCLAQPVHLVAGLAQVRLGALDAARPTEEEATALAATIGAHFGDAGPMVVAFIDDAWLLRFKDRVECETQAPETVVGHDVHDAMPTGRDGARLRSLMNEIQMLLHEHPVNERRQRSRQQPINGWWLWGFGAQPPAPVAKAQDWSLRSDDAWLRALWPAADTAHALAFDGDTLIAVTRPPSPRSAQALADVDAGLLHGLAASLRSGAIGRLDLLAGDRQLSLGRNARWAFWRRPLGVAGWLE